ncbi:MAG: bifunctional uridylyltransferase/uridylyl-removing protein, partial [Betaproteobacteria bacterium]|nr:bifunctional uridylyltransferase/uridylyl-removing protein [Betaproteobacteria bacterium]
MSELRALRDAYRQHKAVILQRLDQPSLSPRRVRGLLQALSQHADSTLCQLAAHAQLPPGVALLAVGGYGRGELFPSSDIDVLILLDDAAGPEHEATLRSVEQFVSSCWDAGLEIGSSVRTVAECLAESAKDVTVQTALLEHRLVCGSAALLERFANAFDAAMNPQAFLVAKTLEMRQRHSRFEDTPYALEPNCKESPGGLRDLQVILWVARAAGLGRSWAELCANGLATPFEVQRIERNEALLFLIRARLHHLARRREDRLVFDLQTAVAEHFGYRSTLPQDGKGALVRASEALMKRYYWAAKAVTQLNQILLLNIEERLNPTTHSLRPINARFNDKAGMVDVVSDDLYQREPHAILETFLVYQQGMGLKGLSARTLRALYNARDLMDARFRSDPVNRAT